MSKSQPNKSVKSLRPLLFFLIALGFLVVPYAQAGITNPLEGGPTTVEELIQGVVRWLLSMVGLLSVLALVWGGIMYITAFVDEGQTQKAKKIILWAVIGFILTGLSYAILILIKTKIFGIESMN